MGGKKLKQKIKQSFSNVKDHIKHLEKEIQYNKLFSEKQAQEIGELKRALNKPQTTEISPQETISTGNKGVYSRIHALFTHSKISSERDSITQKGIKAMFRTLTNKEFLVFLTIFELGDKQPVTYDDIATRLSLTKGCIRSYVSSLINKNAPITKDKINNQLVVLSIDKDFKTLTSSQKLVNLYYSSADPSQTTLL